MSCGSFIDESFESDTTYFYAVRAVANGEASGFSNIIEVKRLPKSVAVVLSEELDGAVKLKWNESNGAEWYKITAKIEGKKETVNVIGTELILEGNTITDIKIRACNNLGESEDAFIGGLQAMSFTGGYDSDSDGLTDFEEEQLGTNLYSPDSDGDGLWDGFELIIGTNPMKYDSDGDGIPDGLQAASRLFRNTDGTDGYAVTKSAGRWEVEIGGGINIFRSKIVIAQSQNAFLLSLKDVFEPVNVLAQNAENIQIAFNLAGAQIPTTMANLRIYYVNAQEKKFEQITGAVLDGSVLKASVEKAGTYIVADKSVQTDYSKDTQVVILIEKQYIYDNGYFEYYCNGHTEYYCNGHTEKYCDGHTEYYCNGHTSTYCPGHEETYCPGHEPFYACVIHPRCNGGRIDCILMVPWAFMFSDTEEVNEHEDDCETDGLITPMAVLEYCSGCKTRTVYHSPGCQTETTYHSPGCQTRTTYHSPGCKTRTTYCSGCESQWVSNYINKLTDTTYKEIDVASALTTVLNQADYEVGIAQNTSSGGMKASFTTSLQQKLNALNSMKNYYAGPTQDANLNNAKQMFSTGDIDKRIIYIRLNGSPSALQTQIQSAYTTSGIKTDVISMFSGTDAYKTQLTQAAQAGQGAYYEVNINGSVEQTIEEICSSIISVWETEEWVYGRDRVENRQMTFSDIYAGLENEEVNQWLSNAAANLLTGGYIAQSTDLSYYGASEYLKVLRTYNSLSGNTAGYFGKGYSSIFDAKSLYVNDSTKALVTTPTAELFVSPADIEAGRYVSKGTEITLVGEEGNYSKISFDGAEYYIKTSCLYKGAWYNITLPTGGTDKLINEGGVWSPLSGVATLSLTDGLVYTSKDRVEYRFDENGRITQICDKKGEKLNFTYNSGSITVEDIYGNMIAAAVTEGKITQLTAGSRSVLYTYNGDGFLMSVKWSSGGEERQESYKYNSITGLLEEVKDANDKLVLSLDYDMLGRIRNKYIHWDDDKTSREAFTYDNINFEVYNIKSNGTKYRVTYNALLEPLKESYIDSDNNEIVLWQNQYYFYDDVAEEWVDYTNCSKNDAVYNRYTQLQLEGVGKRTVYTELLYYNGVLTEANTVTEYDERGNIVKSTDAKGNAETFEYDIYDNLIKHTDKLGNITLYTYSADGIDLLYITDALNRVTLYEYYGLDDEPYLAHKVKKVSYSTGESVEFTYDEKGNTASEVKNHTQDTAQYNAAYEYYLDGKLKKQTVNGNVTEYTYKQLGELAGVEDEIGEATYFYDGNGRLISQIDEKGIITNYQLYLDGKVKSKTIVEGGVTVFEESYEYNSAGLLVSKAVEGGVKYRYIYDYAGRLIEEQEIHLSQTGQEVLKFSSYEYDRLGLLTKSIDSLGNVTLNFYDQTKNLILTKKLDSSAESNDRITEFAYDALNRLVQTTHPSGATEAVQYDALGRVTKITNKEGNFQTFVYDDVLSSVVKTDEAGNVNIEYYGLFGIIKEESIIGGAADRTATFVYDGNGNLIEQNLPQGKRITYVYDSRGRLTRQRLYDNGNMVSQTTRQYDEVNNLVKETLANGLEIIYGYDALKRVVSKTQWDGERNITESYRYDADGRLVETVDALENETVFSYIYSNGDYLTITATRADGSETSISYDRAGNVIKQTDALGNQKLFAYNAFGNLVCQIDGDRETLFEYDKMGNNTKITDALENETHFIYDTMGRLTLQTNADGGTLSYTYDALGNVASITDGRGFTTDFTYDRYGNKTKTQDALENETHYSYDKQNNLISQTNALSETTQYTYDIQGFLTSVTAGGVIYSYFYNAMGKLTKVTDPAGYSKKYQYDLFGNTTKFTDETAHSETYTYDALSRLTSKTDRAGNTTEYFYDSVGNLVRETTSAEEYTYTYNFNGELIEVYKDSLLETSYTYTPYGEVNSIDYGNGYVVSYEYDYCSNKTKAQFLGEQLLYTYDSLNRIKTVTAGGVTTTYTYDLNGNTTKVQTGGSISSQYTFNALNLPLTQTNSAGASTEVSSYSYDALGRITSKTEEGVLTAYTYDSLGRLTQVTEGGKLTSYTYDSRSNRLTKTVNESGTDLTETYTYDENGRLTQLASGGISTLFTYDLNGNQTQVVKDGGETDTYAYNSRNELISADVNDELSEFSYYRSGLRSNKDGTTYIYDGKNVLAEITEDTIRLNAYGNALILTIQGEITTADGVISVTGVGVYAYGQNLHGDITKVVSLAGILYNSYRYDAFGILVEKTEVVTNTFFYSGYQYDSETGLYYLRSRYYNPETARFITEDSFTGYYTDPLSLNKYTYCHNNPISYSDPDGYAISNLVMVADDGRGSSGGYVPDTSQGSAPEQQQTQAAAETQSEETSFWKKAGNWLKNAWNKTTEWVEENASYIVSGVQIAAGIALMATGLGAGLGASLIIGGTLGIATNVFGSQVGAV